DEAQDYSPFQFAVLKRLFPRSRFTILGDFNQAIYPHIEKHDHFFAHLPFSQDIIKRYTLNKSYRSTMEIMKFAQAILRSEKELVPFERHGKKPLLFIHDHDQDRYQALANQIRQLQKDGQKMIAILCKTETEAIKVHKILSQKYHIPL